MIKHKSVLKFLNLFYLNKINNPCQIAFYSGIHCNLVEMIMNNFKKDFARNLFFFRYKNRSNSILKEYCKVGQRITLGIGKMQKKIFHPRRISKKKTSHSDSFHMSSKKSKGLIYGWRFYNYKISYFLFDELIFNSNSQDIPLLLPPASISKP